MRILLTVISVALSGCAALRVEVSILDRSVVDELYISDRLDEALPVLKEKEEIEAKVKALKDAHREVYEAPVKVLQSVPDEISDSGILEKFTEEIKTGFNEIGWNNLYDNLYDNFQNDWTNQNTKIQVRENELYESEKDPAELRGQMWSLLKDRDKLIENFFDSVRKDLDKIEFGDVNPNKNVTVSDEELNNIASIKEKILTAIAGAEERLSYVQESITLFTSGGLEHSRYAAVVAGADDDRWHDKFDFARGGGLFGDVDVAIKALGPTNFTIKGLAFNPSDVALAASKVTTQSLLLAAQISGVPVNIQGTPSGDGETLALASAGAQNPRADLVEAETKIAEFDLALDSVASVILAEAEGIESGVEAEITEALTAIRNNYTNQKARLEGVQTPAAE